MCLAVHLANPQSITIADGYQTAAKRCVLLESQGFSGLLEIICIQGEPRDYRWHLGCILLRVPAMIVRTGGTITQVEAEEMAKIVKAALADAAKSGVQCRVQLTQMSYFDFLQKFDPAK